MNIPFFSIIIPIYNVEKYIKECIQSCLDQTFQDFEIVVIDDCGSDNSAAIVREFKDSRIKIFHNIGNMGLLYNRFFGIKNARGEYILFLDGDDFLCKLALEKIHNFIQNNHSDIIAFDMIRFPSQKKIYQPFNTKKKQTPSSLFMHKKISGYICGKIFKREKINEIINTLDVDFFPKINLFEDIVFSFLCYANYHNISYLPKILYFYRENPTSLTQNKKQIFSKIRDIKMAKKLSLITKLKVDNLKR